MANPISRAMARAFNQIAYGEQDPYTDLRTSSGLGVAATWWPGGSFDSSRVNYDRARKLYRNTLPQYKLGAHFARPIINFTAGFMGVPHFKHKGDIAEADKALTDFNQKFMAKFLTSNRNMLRDGDVYMRLDYVPNRLGTGSNFAVRLINPEWCQPIFNPISGEWDSFVITHPVYPQDYRLNDSRTYEQRQVQMLYSITETVTPEYTSLLADEKAPADVRGEYDGTQRPNPWGFIPIVAFYNEPETNQVYGASDLEPLEPLFRAYHDTMLVGAQGIKLFAKPKVKFTLKDVNRFLRDNFPDWRPGQAVSFQGKEIFLLTEGEDANYITADPGTAGVGTLLEFLFYCIVQCGGVPEFVLGAGVQSSRASVETQLGPFVKTIERKRLMAQDPYTELHQMFLAMAIKAPGFGMPRLDTFEVEAVWPEMTPKDEQSIAQTISTLITAFSAGTAAGIISLDAANEFLRDYIPTLLPWLDESGAINTGEQARVLKSLAWLERVQSGNLTDLSGAAPVDTTGLVQKVTALAAGRNGTGVTQSDIQALLRGENVG